MIRRRRNKKYMYVLILFLASGIGFAALAANLKIDGTLNVSRTSWDVHFENVNITNGSVTANPAPTSDDTTTTEMTYTINFTKPGDFYEFTVDMANDGTIDAMVDVVSNNAYATAASTTPITLPTYLRSTVTYDDDVPIKQNQKLDHGTSEKVKVRVEFRTDISASDLPSSGDTSIVFKFIGNYKQADDNAIGIRCPGSDCVYAFPMFNYSYTTDEQTGITTYTYDENQWWISDGTHALTMDGSNVLTTGTHQKTTLQETDYKTNYEDVIQESGKNYFLGMILNNDKTINKAYVCYKKNNEVKCQKAETGDITTIRKIRIVETIFDTPLTKLTIFKGEYDTQGSDGNVYRVQYIVQMKDSEKNCIVDLSKEFNGRIGCSNS